LLNAMQSAIADDGNFSSLVRAAVNLLFLYNAKWLLNLEDLKFADELLEQVYIKAVALIPGLETKQENEDREFAKVIKELNQIAQRDNIDKELLYEALLDFCEQNAPPPCLHGSAAGLLYSAGRLDCEQVIKIAESYFYGTGEIIKKAGIFLAGLFISAWDLVFTDARFTGGITSILKNFTHEDFLLVLPDLRLAFSSFTPNQIDKLAKIIAENLGVSDDLRTVGISEKLLELGREIDKYAIGAINK